MSDTIRITLPDGSVREVPQGTTGVPVQGLSGSHAYAQGKVAGSGAAGKLRSYAPVHVPWGLVGGKWMVGGVSFGETLATALGMLRYRAAGDAAAGQQGTTDKRVGPGESGTAAPGVVRDGDHARRVAGAPLNGHDAFPGDRRRTDLVRRADPRVAGVGRLAADRRGG